MATSAAVGLGILVAFLTSLDNLGFTTQTPWRHDGSECRNLTQSE